MGRASQRFDRQTFTLKLSELSDEMQTKSVASDKKASAASRATGGSLLPNIVNGQLALLGEWLRGVDLIARGVWQTQGEPITPDFVRDVLVPEAMTLIAVRDSVIKSSVELVAMRTRLKNHHDALRHLAIKIRKLKGEVANRYQIEARELEYQRAAIEKEVNVARGREIEAARARLMERSIKATELAEARLLPQADDWQSFQREFRALGNEEEQIDRLAPKDRLLRAYCSYREHPEVWEKGKPEQGLFCLLDTPPHGIWTISDGVNENLQARFRALAARAGSALGAPNGSDPEDFWLHRLWLNLRENDSDQLFAASEEGGVILRVCVASATFCSRLERKAVTGADRPRTGEKQGQSPRAENSDKTTQNERPSYQEQVEKYSRWNETELAVKFGEAGQYVNQLCKIDRKLKGNWSRRSETALELHNNREALVAILLRDYPEAAQELGLRMAERVKGEPEHSNTASPAENNAKTTSESKPTLPATWDELRKRLSITQREAAEYLQRKTKTVQRLVKDKELKQSAKKRIICDEKLRNQIRKVHGTHVLP
jgi:hypothetical protein